jgi:hypothetical protein
MRRTSLAKNSSGLSAGQKTQRGLRMPRPHAPAPSYAAQNGGFFSGIDYKT